MNTITIEPIRLYLIFHCFFPAKINIIFLHIILLFQKSALWLSKHALDTKQVDCSGKELAYFIVILFHLVQWCHLKA